MIRGDVHFASYGDPYFEKVLRMFEQFELPGCVRRISVSVHGLEHIEVVGFAVACIGADGMRQVRFIQEWRDLDGLELAEDESLTDDEIEPLRHQLEMKAEQEFGYYRALARLERDNQRAGRAQEILNLLVIESLLEDKVISDGRQANFVAALRSITSRFENKDYVRAVLPANKIRRISNELLFDCHVPNVGDKASMIVSQILAQTSADTASRIADGLKENKKSLRLGRVMNRIKNELKNKERELRSLGG